MLWKSWVLGVCVSLMSGLWPGCPGAIAETQPAETATPVAETTTPATEPALAMPSLSPVTPENVAALADRIKKSVVVVSCSDRDGKAFGIGSGFIIREDGLIATNLHVIGEARPISVRTIDGHSFPVESIFAHEKSQDLVILKIAATGLAALELGDSDTLVQGQPVVAIGNPQGLEHSVVAGVVSGLRKDVEGMSMIQLAIPIEPGNSGGPLVDLSGRVHGLLTMKSLVTDNLGYAVTINSLKPLLAQPNPIAMSKWLTIGTLNPRRWIVPGDVRWTQRAGRIRVTGTGSGFGGRSLCLSTAIIPEAPFEIGVSVKVDQDDGAAGLVLFHNEDTHYGFYPSSGKLRFTRFDGPTVYEWNVLWEEARPEYREGEWNHLKVHVEADRIQCFCNDVLVHEDFDLRYRTGKAGLAKFRHTAAEFRQFETGAKIVSQAPTAELLADAANQVALLSRQRPPTTSQIAPLLGKPEALHAALEAKAIELEQSAKRLRQLSREIHEARHRQQLVEVLASSEDQIDLARAALLIAAIDNPEFNVEDSLQSLDDLANDFLKSLPEGISEADKLPAFHRFLFDEQGFHGSRVNYYNPSNSYLNETIDDREGLPITLSVVYMTLARRVGLKVEGVGLPGHFVVRYVQAMGEPTLVDPFDRGKTLSVEEAKSMVSETGRAWDDESLIAQTSKQIVIRMMRNLLNLANESQDPEAALRYVETILALDPESLSDQLLKAVLCYNTQRYDEGIEVTDRLIQSHSPDLRLDQLRQMQEQMKARRELQLGK